MILWKVLVPFRPGQPPASPMWFSDFHHTGCKASWCPPDLISRVLSYFQLLLPVISAIQFAIAQVTCNWDPVPFLVSRGKLVFSSTVWVVIFLCDFSTWLVDGVITANVCYDQLFLSARGTEVDDNWSFRMGRISLQHCSFVFTQPANDTDDEIW